MCNSTVSVSPARSTALRGYILAKGLFCFPFAAHNWIEMRTGIENRILYFIPRQASPSRCCFYTCSFLLSELELERGRISGSRNVHDNDLSWERSSCALSNHNIEHNRRKENIQATIWWASPLACAVYSEDGARTLAFATALSRRQTLLCGQARLDSDSLTQYNYWSSNLLQNSFVL